MRHTKLFLLMALIIGLLTFVACSSDHENPLNSDSTTEITDSGDDLDDFDTGVTFPDPAPLTEIRFAETACGEIRVEWEYAEKDVDGIVLERRINETGQGIWERIELDYTETEFLDTDIEPGISYSYRLMVFRGDQFSEWSDEFDFDAATEELETPSGFAAEVICGQGVLLTWVDEGTGAGDYIIMCAGPYAVGTEPNWIVVDTVDANSTEYLDTRKSQLIRFYRICAVNACTRSEYAYSETVIIPSLPAAPVSATTQIRFPYKSLVLKWEAQSNNEDGFIIYRYVEVFGGRPRLDATYRTGAGETYLQDNDIQSGKTYIYRIFAQNCTGKSVDYAMVRISIPIV